NSHRNLLTERGNDVKDFSLQRRKRKSKSNCYQSIDRHFRRDGAVLLRKSRPLPAFFFTLTHN
ncbi:MAG: hypothetical protein ACD_75C02418G0001, partial [uncultured bacterium]